MRILRGLTSRLLTCGCLAGIYETYDGAVVTLIDDRDPQCPSPSHVAGHEVPEFSVTPQSSNSEVRLQSDAQRKP